MEVDYTLDRPTAGLRFESQPRHCYSLRCPGVLHDVDGPRCWFPCADRSTDVFSLDMAVAVPDYEEEDEEEEGAAAPMEQDGAATPTGADVRKRPLTVLVGGGRLLGREKRRHPSTGARAEVWRYAIDTPVPAAAVSLVVGPFARWVDPAAPRVSHYYLAPEALEEPEPASPPAREAACLLPPKAWVKASVAGMGPVLAFLADFFNLTPPHQHQHQHQPAASSSSASGIAAASQTTAGAGAGAAAAPAPVTLEHRTVFVRNLPEASLPFHGLALHRAEALHPPALFDGHMALHFALAEGLLGAWLLPRLRPRLPRDHWIYHGVVGYLLLLYVRRRYGEHEYRYRLLRLMDQVAALER